MLLSHPARGLRRIELTTDAAEPTADFFSQLLGWAVLPEPDDVFGGWVGDRLAVRISPGDAVRWRLVFAGTPVRALEHGASVDRGRVLHGPWAPEPRPGEPCWVELLGIDDADDHYATELGWTARDPEEPFSLFDVDLDGTPRPVAGRLTADTGLPPGWMVYFSVPDLDAAVASAADLGGSVVVEPREVPTGLIASIADPAGAVVTLLQTPAGWGGAWAHVPEPSDSGTT
ncbi:MAG TPA: VOC family protein [Umezawaea sp.]|nr:VOC family protein [Umezawaea sp.]